MTLSADLSAQSGANTRRRDYIVRIETPMKTRIAALLMLLAGMAPVLPVQAQDPIPIEQTTKKTTSTTTTTTTDPAPRPVKKVVRHTRRTRRAPVRRHAHRVYTAPPGSVTVHTVIRRQPSTRVRVIVP